MLSHLNNHNNHRHAIFLQLSHISKYIFKTTNRKLELMSESTLVPQVPKCNYFLHTLTALESKTLAQVLLEVLTCKILNGFYILQ